MYTTPLSNLISSCSLNRHLYADDTQLFLSFLPTHFDSSIDHLHNALDRVSSWMTANFLTLNSSMIKFLLIGLSKQLAKINNSTQLTLFETPASYLMNTSLILTRSHFSVRRFAVIQDEIRSRAPDGRMPSRGMTAVDYVTGQRRQRIRRRTGNCSGVYCIVSYRLA